MIEKIRSAVILLSIIMLSGCMLIPVDGIQTPTAEGTLIPTAVPTQTTEPTADLTPIASATPLPPIYFPQTGTPAYIANFAHPAKGCSWMGVAGQVFGPDSMPVLNLIVAVKGKLGETPANVFSMTGLAEGDAYGPGGYEIKLANQATTSSGSLTIQVFDLDAKPLSSPLTFDTFSDCSKNLVIINFTADEN